MSAPDLARVEEAALNALQTQRPVFYDGWLLRLSPGSARRSRSVNAHFGSGRPLDQKIRHCEKLYATRALPILFRKTPFSRPDDVVTDTSVRGQGVATRIVERPPTWAWERGAAHAYLQVEAANAAALAVYRKFGSSTVYEYHHRGRPGAGS